MGVNIIKQEAQVAEKTEFKPASEPMVFTEGSAPVPLSEYKGDLVDPSTVGVIDESSPAALPPRAVVDPADAPAAKASTSKVKK